METLVSYLCMWQCNVNCPAHVENGHSSLALLHQRKKNNHNFFFCMSVTIKCSSSLKLMLLVKSPLSIWILLLCSACFKLCPSSNGPVLQTFIISKLVTPFLEQVELKRLYWGNEIGVKGGVNQFLDGIAEVMYGSNSAILFISQHLTSSLFSWKPFKDVNVVFTLGLIEEILLNFRGRVSLFSAISLFLRQRGALKESFLRSVSDTKWWRFSSMLHLSTTFSRVLQLRSCRTCILP